jgi:hypothetical protein
MNFNSTLLDTSGLQYALWRAYLTSIVPNPELEQSSYRPSGWSAEEPLTYIEDEEDKWYFDAVIRTNHRLSQYVTEHPIQSGANISDHSFQLPIEITLEIGMSDVMSSYKETQWGESFSPDATETAPFYSRSVTAFEKLKEWKDNGISLVVKTRLEEYENFVIKNIDVLDDVATRYGLKAEVTFKQIFVVETEEYEDDSLRPAVTEQSGLAPTAEPLIPQ